MGKFRVEINIKKANNEVETLIYKENQLVDFDTNTFATSNPSRLECNSYPSEGTVVIKDTNLEFYNRAINGEFDNAFNFEVLIYKGDNLFARHIVNQRPQYNYTSKTLTLNLGNEIDTFDNILVKGFSYDNTTKRTAKDLIEQLLKTYFREDDGYSVEFLIEGINLIPIENIYFPANQTLKEVLRQLLEVLGASIIIGNDKTFKIVGISNSPTTISPIKILPKHIQGSFIPDVILDNRFTNIKLNTKNVTEKTQKQAVKDISLDTSYLDNSEDHFTGTASKNISSVALGDVTTIFIRHLSQSYTEISTFIPKNFNNNLSKLLSLEISKFDTNNVYDNSSPVFSTICKKVVYKYLGSNTPIGDITQEEIDGISNTSLWEQESIETIEVADLYKTNFSYYEGETFKGSLDYNVPQFQEFIGANISNFFFLEANDFEYFFRSFALCGKKYLQTVSITDTQNILPVRRTTQLVNYIPISISVSFNGVVKQIVFEDKTISSTSDNTNVYENTKENYFLQEGLGYTNEPLSTKILNYYQEYFKNGIRTGSLSCIFSNYKNSANELLDKDTILDINEYVIPCKDNFGTPIMSKKVQYQDYTSETFKISGQTIYAESDTLYYYRYYTGYKKPIETVYLYNITGVKAIYGLSEDRKSVGIFIYSHFYKDIVQCDVFITFKEDIEVNIPTVYKVVGRKISNNGGAGLQDLTLVEVPIDYFGDIENQIAEYSNLDTVYEDLLYVEEINDETSQTKTTNDENDLKGL